MWSLDTPSWNVNHESYTDTSTPIPIIKVKQLISRDILKWADSSLWGSDIVWLDVSEAQGYPNIGTIEFSSKLQSTQLASPFIKIENNTLTALFKVTPVKVGATNFWHDLPPRGTLFSYSPQGGWEGKMYNGGIGLYHYFPQGDLSLSLTPYTPLLTVWPNMRIRLDYKTPLPYMPLTDSSRINVPYYYNYQWKEFILADFNEGFTLAYDSIVPIVEIGRITQAYSVSDAKNREWAICIAPSGSLASGNHVLGSLRFAIAYKNYISSSPKDFSYTLANTSNTSGLFPPLLTRISLY